MPKVKISQKTKLQLYQQEFEGEMISTDNEILYCRGFFDFCEALLAADIPLWKLTNPTLRNFIEKYIQCKVPDESTVRKNYVKQCYDLTIGSIRDKIQDNFVWVSIDETQDCEGLFIANCIVGFLNKN
ncbi:hypothetical protein B7P43_G13645 [Cryptotermes secundus]|uniref:DUF659 domain-containing protein n=1 Tax=Cryptotermes secundus TaxID=105785 RepID=A0A2J7QUS3_9NEOP|nr:hypothetical protein B7P43_G13645 [Cryptotermes secundus]